MARQTRRDDWGFPRWRPYGSSRAAEKMRLCDRHGCAEPGTCPAPKAPNSPERWMFCTQHAAEYNKGWDYFAGLNEADAAERAAREGADARAYAKSQYDGWGGPGDGSRSRDEMRALDVLGMDPDSDIADIKVAWRALAKANHPDLNPGDDAAADRFQAVQAAWEVLRTAEERRAAVRPNEGTVRR
jgi:curved DNA-binding protein CbpA